MLQRLVEEKLDILAAKDINPAKFSLTQAESNPCFTQEMNSVLGHFFSKIHIPIFLYMYLINNLCQTIVTVTFFEILTCPAVYRLLIKVPAP